jgi:four helix bundle protein
MLIKDFKDLEIWKLALIITKDIYVLTATEKFRKDWDLVSQIRRAVISISSNIVEGFEKSNNNEFVRFLKISKGSIGEVRNQLEIAYIVGYINLDNKNNLDQKLIVLSTKTGALIKYLKNYKIKNSKPVTRN